MAVAFQSTSLSCLSMATGPAFCQVLVAGEQTVAACYTSVTEEERFVRLVYNPSIHPSISSEIIPFSDFWLVVRSFQTEPQAAGGCNKLKWKNKT